MKFIQAAQCKRVVVHVNMLLIKITINVQQKIEKNMHNYSMCVFYCTTYLDNTAASESVATSMQVPYNFINLYCMLKQ